MADQQGFEPLPPSSQGVDSQKLATPPLNQSSLISSLKAGSDCPELSEIEDAWPLLSPALRSAILSIVRSVEREVSG